jgi:hypothetical protein
MSFWAADFWQGMGVGGGVIVNDGIVAELNTMQVEVELQDSPVIAEVDSNPIVVEVGTPAIEVEIYE